MSTAAESGYHPADSHLRGARRSSPPIGSTGSIGSRGPELLALGGATRNQGDTPTCVANAIAACMEVLCVTTRQRRVRLSAQFLYHQAIGGQEPLRNLTLEEGLEVAASAGLCTRSRYAPPYTTAGLLEPVSSAAEREARDYRMRAAGEGYWRLYDSGRVKLWRDVLARRRPVLAGIWITEEYWRLDADHPVHSVPGQGFQSGHCVAVVGHDDAAAAFHVVDSMPSRQAPSRLIGLDGRWLLPYLVVDTPLVEESFILDRLAP